MKFRQKLKYFSIFEWCLWLLSTLTIIVTFCIFDRSNFLSLIASLIGVTALIFCAKGNPIGQMLMIVFCILYGIISFNFRYFGEMITYLGMSMPMAIIALISWLKNPYKGNRAQVKVNKICYKEMIFLFFLNAGVTTAFYFTLRALNTNNLIPSTISVATSFLAVYLTFRRSPYYAVFYALNDVVLIVLWTMATLKDYSYVSVIICFVVFLINDIYGFINWKKLYKMQNSKIENH